MKKEKPKKDTKRIKLTKEKELTVRHPNGKKAGKVKVFKVE